MTNGLGRNAFVVATLNRMKRWQAHSVPLRVFDTENVLFSLSSEGISKLIMQAEQEHIMTQYERSNYDLITR